VTEPSRVACADPKRQRLAAGQQHPAAPQPDSTPPQARRATSAPSSAGSGSTGLTVLAFAPSNGYTPDSAALCWGRQHGARTAAAGARTTTRSARSPRVPPSAFATAAAQLPEFPTAAAAAPGHGSGCVAHALSGARASGSRGASPAGSALLPDPAACRPPPAPQLAPLRSGSSAFFEGFLGFPTATAAAANPAQQQAPWGGSQSFGGADARGAAYAATALGNGGILHSASSAPYPGTLRTGSLPPLHQDPVQRCSTAAGFAAAPPRVDAFKTSSLGAADLPALQIGLSRQPGGFPVAGSAVPAVPTRPQSIGSKHLQDMRHMPQQPSQRLPPGSLVRLRGAPCCVVLPVAECVA